jgi:hypothetical protein
MGLAMAKMVSAAAASSVAAFWFLSFSLVVSGCWKK